MERSNSVASTTHKRTLSTKFAESKNATSSIITLFVRNVRLLNLDLLPDWPFITPASFGNQDARTRIRSAEWCLYHLFRVYDPATTTEKLQPFFPPLEPLQSINLRAALYRCLNELKKNGVLGRETVLRKSMLDDCQGDKFWELCLSFSTIVLRKVTVEKQNKFGKPLAESIGTAQGLGKTQCDSMLPLSIAHRAALTKVLSKKERKRQSFARLFQVFTEKEEDLQERKLEAQERGHRRLEKASIAQEVLVQSWMGSNDLRSALINGDEVSGGDLVLRPFDTVWEANERDQLFSSDYAEIGILQDLENRTQQQKRRLAKWQRFHEDLVNSKPPSSRDSNDSGKGFQFSFDKHQDLTLRDLADNPTPPASPSRHAKHDSVTKYDYILTAMREELRKKSAAAQQTQVPDPENVPQSRPQSFRQSSISHEFSNGMSDHHQRSHSQAAAPMRPTFGKRMSSRSRSYQQPKVVSQREFIPLKSEIFSPLKTARPTSMSPSSSGRMSVLASPVEAEEASSPGAQIDKAISAPSRDMRHGSDASIRTDSTAGLGISRSNTPTRNNSGTTTPRSTSENPDSAVDLTPKTSHLGIAGRNIDGMGRTVRPASLAERTRMSMAFPIKPAEDAESEAPNQASQDTADFAADSHPATTTTITTSDRRQSTLLDRTRQSISSTAVPLKLHKRPSHSRSRTSAFPVNPFETPEKARRRSTMTLDVQAGGERRDVTPKEKLFEQDAEYSSIFKARPKVALSPIGSPRETSFVESLVGEEVHMDESPSIGGGRQ